MKRTPINRTPKCECRHRHARVAGRWSPCVRCDCQTHKWPPRKPRKPLPKRRVRARRTGIAIRDPGYRRWIRTLPCAARLIAGHVCSGRIVCAHVGRTGKGTGIKCSDYETIALCDGAHRAEHGNRFPFRMRQFERRRWMEARIFEHQGRYLLTHDVEPRTKTFDLVTGLVATRIAPTMDHVIQLMTNPPPTG